MRALSPTPVVLLTLLLAAGSQGRAEPAPGEGTKPAPPAAPVAEPIVFQAKCYQTSGPCFRAGTALVRPLVKGFEVTVLSQGQMRTRRVQVVPRTESGHLTEVFDGKRCTVRIAPSQITLEQLAQDRKKPLDILWIDGAELTVTNISK